MASDTTWYIALILLILAIILIAAGAIWYASIRKGEWYIWMLIGLGVLFLLISIFMWIYYYQDNNSCGYVNNCNDPCSQPRMTAPTVAVTGSPPPTYYAPAPYQQGHVHYEIPPGTITQGQPVIQNQQYTNPPAVFNSGVVQQTL